VEKHDPDENIDMGANKQFITRGHCFAMLLFQLPLFSLIFSVSAGAQESTGFDHHIHLLSPALIRQWKSIGMTFSREEECYTNPMRLIENERIEGAFLISMAHLYVTEEFRTVINGAGDQRRWVKAENDFIASCVAKSPRHFVGFFSVSPLSDYAIEEMERCKKNPNLTGLKLHLPACGVNLADTKHAEQLSVALAWAEENDVPVLMHLSAGERFDLERSFHFWNNIIRPHSRLELYLAHLGSSGGYNDSSRNILEGFLTLRARDAGFAEQKVYFDLSGAIIPIGSDEATPTSNERCRQLSEQIMRIGVERFLFASDYPVFPIAQSRSVLLESLSIGTEEKEHLLRNVSPRFIKKER